MLHTRMWLQEICLLPGHLSPISSHSGCHGRVRSDRQLATNDGHASRVLDAGFEFFAFASQDPSQGIGACELKLKAPHTSSITPPIASHTFPWSLKLVFRVLVCSPISGDAAIAALSSLQPGFDMR